MCFASLFKDRRTFSAARLTSALAGAALMLGQVARPAAAADEVKLNEVQRILFYTPQYVALRVGAFEQEGVKVIGPKTTWGLQATLTEVVSGNSNIALTGPEAAALTQSADPDRRLVNFAALTDGDGSFIISKTPMPNFKIADLQGKTIVTFGKGGTPSLALEHLIRKAGLNPNRDVRIRYISISANVLASYLEPSTDFGQSFEPGVYLTVEQKKGHRVASIGELLGPMPYTAYMASAAYIEKNPKVIQGFTNAIGRGLLWTDSHSPEEVAKLIAPDFSNIPEQTIAAVVRQYKKVKIWPTTPLITPEGMNKNLDLMVQGGILKARTPYDRVVNPTFAQKAMQTIHR
jgi:NitT/TauT family transport system substrate-binding protein